MPLVNLIGFVEDELEKFRHYLSGVLRPTGFVAEPLDRSSVFQRIQIAYR